RPSGERSVEPSRSADQANGTPKPEPIEQPARVERQERVEQHTPDSTSQARETRQEQQPERQEERQREAAPPAEAKSGTGESRTIAHFEPAPPMQGREQNKPYVVWSSAPSDKASASDSGRDE